ncbi:uncharacterized protein LOC129261313 [Lytechinus pictus]|uniref:uncharacterized protein LOC129261313 n=1 Tax=Lytechinus pictus TaxID=7653 RepID=UPI0030BA2176
MASTDEYKITKEEAFHFLDNVLQIESAEMKLKANKVKFLEDVIKAMHHHIPYQTIKRIAMPDEERRLPTAAGIKSDITSKLGGLCYQLQIFSWMLLRALNFDAHLVPMDGMRRENIHVGIVLKDLTCQGSKHLFEVGTSLPTHRLVPLHFDQGSPEYNDSCMTYRFIHDQNGTFIFQPRVSSVSSLATKYPELIDGKWFSFGFIHTEQTVLVSHFDSATYMRKLFTNVDELFCFIGLLCVSYPNGRLVSIKNSKLTLVDEANQMQHFQFRSDDDFLEAFQRYFPQYPESMIRAAMKNAQFKLP